MARRNFPLSHEELKSEADSILRAHLGDTFPETGVGKQWSYRFVQKYRKQLKMFWSSTMDEKRGRAVNPHTNKEYFDLLEDILAGKRDHEFDSIESVDDGWEEEGEKGTSGSQEIDFDDEEVVGEESGIPGDTGGDKSNSEQIRSHNTLSTFTPILPEDTYGANESGFMPSMGTKQRVIGARTKKMQKKQGDGGRENTTVMVTICADGTAIKPLVIFKGKHYQVQWNQENPTEAS